MRGNSPRQRKDVCSCIIAGGERKKERKEKTVKKGEERGEGRSRGEK